MWDISAEYPTQGLTLCRVINIIISVRKHLRCTSSYNRGASSSQLSTTCAHIQNYLNGQSQLGDEERISTTSSLKSILFNKYEV